MVLHLDPPDVDIGALRYAPHAIASVWGADPRKALKSQFLDVCIFGVVGAIISMFFFLDSDNVSMQNIWMIWSTGFQVILDKFFCRHQDFSHSTYNSG